MTGRKPRFRIYGYHRLHCCVPIRSLRGRPDYADGGSAGSSWEPILSAMEGAIRAISATV